jgi:hypothetical protein
VVGPDLEGLRRLAERRPRELLIEDDEALVCALPPTQVDAGASPIGGSSSRVSRLTCSPSTSR